MLLKTTVCASTNFCALSLDGRWVFKKVMLDVLPHGAPNGLTVDMLCFQAHFNTVSLLARSVIPTCLWETISSLRSSLCWSPPDRSRQQGRRGLTSRRHKHLVPEKDMFSHYHSKKEGRWKVENTLCSHLFSFQRNKVRTNGRYRGSRLCDAVSLPSD